MVTGGTDVVTGTVLVTGGAVVVTGSVVVTGTVVSGRVVAGRVVAGRVVVVGVSPGSSTKFTIGVGAVAAFCTSRERTSPTVSDGFIDSSRAARPATWGEAIEVPEMVWLAFAPEIHADVICEPGAHMSTQDPEFEYEARESSRLVAPIVRALGALAGEYEHASPDSLPAATATTRPAAVASATAESSALLAGPPRLMLTIPRPPGWFAMIQLIPAMTPEV